MIMRDDTTYRGNCIPLIIKDQLANVSTTFYDNLPLKQDNTAQYWDFKTPRQT
jgi:hypothetical protein